MRRLDEWAFKRCLVLTPKTMTIEINTGGASPKEQGLSDLEMLRRAQEKINRRRAELASKAKPKPILTRELGFLVSEDNEVKEASEASKESPGGDFPPKAEPLRADSNTEIQNMKDMDSGKTLLTAS